MAGTSQREIVVNHNHDNEMWTLELKTNNNTQYTNEINRERSSKSLDGYNTRDSVLGNVLTWSDRPESDEQKRHKTEHKTRKKTITVPISPLPPNAAERKDERRKYTKICIPKSRSTRAQSRATFLFSRSFSTPFPLVPRCQYTFYNSTTFGLS